MEENINLRIERREALLLYELLKNIDEGNCDLSKVEKQIIWNLECVLERNLREVFEDNYNDIILKYRKELKEKFNFDEEN